MPHFYFHLHDGEARLEDQQGLSLPDAEAAWYHAYRSARDLLADRRRGREQYGGHCLQVEDEVGAHVWTLPLTEIAELAA
jgi:hypothetical protein